MMVSELERFFFLSDPVCNVVKLTKTMLYMGKMMKNTVFYRALHILYGENDTFMFFVYLMFEKQ